MNNDLTAEHQIRSLWHWVFTHENKIYWVFEFFNWVFVNFRLGYTTLPYILYTISTFLIGYLLIIMLPFNWKNNCVFQKKNWVNTPKSSLSVSLLTMCFCFLKDIHVFTFPNAPTSRLISPRGSLLGNIRSIK